MKASSILLVIASSALVSCDCPGVECCPGSDLLVELWVHDSQGRSMLDSDTPGYFDTDSVKLYSLIEGELKLQTTHDQVRYYPRKLDTLRNHGNLHALLGPFWESSQTFKDAHTTVIQWSTSDSDTVAFELVQECDFPHTKTVWYNGVATHELFIEVTK